MVMIDLSERVAKLEADVAEIKEANRAQDDQLRSIKEDTSGLVEMFSAGVGAAKTLKWFGKGLVWMGSVASGVYALWFAITNWPHKGG